MSIISAIRNELLKLHSVVARTGDKTPTEDIIQHKLAALHDNLVELEQKAAVVNLGALKAVRSAVGAVEASIVQHLDHVIKHADDFAAKVAADKAQHEQDRIQAAARQALAVPPPAPAVIPAVQAADPVTTTKPGNEPPRAVEPEPDPNPPTASPDPDHG